MTAAECADKAALFLAATIPILAVWRYGKLGIVIGALAD